MTELNLLPDIKLEYIKAQRMRRRVMAICVLVTGASVLILVLLLGVGAVQKKHLSDLNKDIAAESSELKNKPDIEKILTVQNDIPSLNELHAKKPAMARVFDYLNQVTPDKVSISELSIDTTTQTVTATGFTDALSTVNKYVDTLKFTKYSEADSDTSTNAFNNVVLSSFGFSTDTAASADQAAGYTIVFQYDPTIFDITMDIKLTVPTLTTTRATVNTPTELFKSAPAKKTEGAN